MSNIMRSGMASAGVLCFLISILLCGCVDQEPEVSLPEPQGIVVEDSLGNTLSFSAPPQRIAVAGADIATVLVMIGAKDQVIGVGESIKKDVQISHYFIDTESLGDSSTISPEKLVSLHPDLLLLYASSQPTNIENLKKTGVQIGYFDCYKQNRLEADILALGEVTGRREKAESLAEYITFITSLVSDRVKNVTEENQVSVYFELGDYTAAANQSGGDWLITTAGGKNIAGNSTIQWVKVTPEWIIAQNPDVIIKNGYAEPGKDFSDVYKQITGRSGFGEIDAVQKNRIAVISSDMLYGAQSCIGLLHVAKLLYPERFTDIDPTVYLDEFSGIFYPEGNMTSVIFPVFHD